MMAVEFHPEAGGTRRLCEALKNRGLLCKETRDHTIRISPPLVLRQSEADWALEQFAAVFAMAA
jgi:ornithine--oxo-acid transaminase